MSEERSSEAYRTFLHQTLQEADEEYKASGLPWYRGQFMAIKLSQAAGIPEEEAFEEVAKYLNAESSNYLSGNIIELPAPNILTRNEEFPRHLAEEEYRIGTFVMGYILHRIGKPEFPLTLIGKQFLGNTPEETMKLIRWMNENIDKVLGYYTWIELNPEDELVAEFKDKQTTGKLREINDQGW